MQTEELNKRITWCVNLTDAVLDQVKKRDTEFKRKCLNRGVGLLGDSFEVYHLKLLKALLLEIKAS